MKYILLTFLERHDKLNIRYFWIPLVEMVVSVNVQFVYSGSFEVLTVLFVNDFGWIQMHFYFLSEFSQLHTSVGLLVSNYHWSQNPTTQNCCNGNTEEIDLNIGQNVYSTNMFETRLLRGMYHFRICVKVGGLHCRTKDTIQGGPYDSTKSPKQQDSPWSTWIISSCAVHH